MGLAGGAAAAAPRLYAHFRMGSGPAVQVTADNISARAALSHWQSTFSRRKDRNRPSSGVLGANQKNPENLFASRADSSPAARWGAGAGAEGARWAPGRAPRSAGLPGGSGRSLLSALDVPLLSGAQPSGGCVGLSTAGFQEFPSGGK